jgi:hypothetical protein
MRPGSPDVTYHGIIAPQIEAYRFQEQQTLALRQLQGQVQGLQQPVSGVTGHPSYFLNYSHFYPAAAAAAPR